MALRPPRRGGRSITARIGAPHALMVVAGLATFVLVSSVLRDRPDGEPVWMVRSDVAAGAFLDANDLEPMLVSVDEPIAASLLPVDAGVPNGRVRSGVVAGEPLLASDLVPVDQVVDGRSFTIPIDAVVLDGLGLIRGDRIDVIGADADGAMGYIVADVEVVRLPSETASSAFAAANSRSVWVTVAIDHRQALALSESLDRGEVELVRSTGAAPIRSTGGGS